MIQEFFMAIFLLAMASVRNTIWFSRDRWSQLFRSFHALSKFSPKISFLQQKTGGMLLAWFSSFLLSTCTISTASSKPTAVIAICKQQYQFMPQMPMQSAQHLVTLLTPFFLLSCCLSPEHLLLPFLCKAGEAFQPHHANRSVFSGFHL